MKSLMGLFLLIFSQNLFACLDFPIKFNVSGSSFPNEEFLLKKNQHGAVFSNNGTELYFNYAKHSWCMSEATIAKEKEHCLGPQEKIILTDSKDPSKKIGIIQIGKDERTLLLKSVDSHGNADLSKPYLKISDLGQFTSASADNSQSAVLKTNLIVEMVTPQGVKGKAEVKADSTKVSPDGSVSYPRFRSLGMVPKEAASINDLGGQYLSKSSCGFTRDPFTENASGASTTSNGAE